MDRLSDRHEGTLDGRLAPVDAVRPATVSLEIAPDAARLPSCQHTLCTYGLERQIIMAFVSQSACVASLHGTRQSPASRPCAAGGLIEGTPSAETAMGRSSAAYRSRMSESDIKSRAAIPEEGWPI